MASFLAGACKGHGVWKWNREQSDRGRKRNAPFHKALLLSVGCTTLRLTPGGATQPLYFEYPIASYSNLLKWFSSAVFWFVHSDSLAPCEPESFPTSAITAPTQERASFSWEDSSQHPGFGDGDIPENLDYSCYTYGSLSYKSKCSLRCGLCSLTFRSALIWLNSPYKIWPNNFLPGLHGTLKCLEGAFQASKVHKQNKKTIYMYTD